MEPIEATVLKLIFESSEDSSLYDINEALNNIKKNRQKIVFIKRELKNLKRNIIDECYISLYDYINEKYKLVMIIINLEFASIFVLTLPMILASINYNLFYVLVVYLLWGVVFLFIYFVYFLLD